MAINSVTTRRKSNIELLRIVAMFFIVAHHFVVNSGLTDGFDPLHTNARQLFLSFWGCGGKIGIIAFVAISGYFMCQSQLTLKRYLKVLLVVLFYSVCGYLFICAVGYDQFSVKKLCNKVLYLEFFYGANESFTPAFLWMYLLVPFVNVFLKNATRRQCYLCLGVLFGLFTVCGTINPSRVGGGYHWVACLTYFYIIGAVIRMHPFKWMDNNRLCLFLLAASLLATFLSIAFTLYIAHKRCVDALCGHHFVSGANILAISNGVLLFLVFKNLKMGYSKSINLIASTCFGVLLIHANSNEMRQLLWRDIVRAPDLMKLPTIELFVAALLIPIAVFVVCSVIDILRIQFVERPLFGWFFERKSQ